MKIAKIITVASINGRCYRTAIQAATAYAEQVNWNSHDRHAKKIGHAAYHDREWYNKDLSRLDTAYRRALPLFKKVLP